MYGIGGSGTRKQKEYVDLENLSDFMQEGFARHLGLVLHSPRNVLF